MARIVASPRVACSVAAAVVLIASHTGAASQALDPGWQLVYAGQPGYDDGLIESMFGDGTGQAIVGRAYQPPAPIYSEADPTAELAPEPSAQERAPVSPQLSQQQPASVAATRHTRRGRPAPVYYQLVPAQQARAAGQGPVYYQQAPAQFAVAPPAPASGWRAVPQAQAPAQVDPRYVASVSPGQLRGSQSQPAGYRTAAAPPAQTDPRYTGSVTTQQVRTIQPPPANYRTAAAQPVQPSAQYAASAPPQRSADYSRPIIRWRPPPKPARIRSPASTRSSRSVSSLRSDTQRNRSRAMRIRRRLTPRRPLGTWRSSSRSIRAMSVK